MLLVNLDILQQIYLGWNRFVMRSTKLKKYNTQDVLHLYLPEVWADYIISLLIPEAQIK